MIDTENRFTSGNRDMEERMEGEKVADVVIKVQQERFCELYQCQSPGCDIILWF